MDHCSVDCVGIHSKALPIRQGVAERFAGRTSPKKVRHDHGPAICPMGPGRSPTQRAGAPGRKAGQPNPFGNTMIKCNQTHESEAEFDDAIQKGFFP